MRKKILFAFTMAEILLSLTIIGVVAAITLPSLTGNINEKTWNTQKKALYARLSQAIALIGSVNGYGEYAGTWSDDTVTTTVDTAANAFVTEGLSKVLKINNICDNTHFDDCGIPREMTTIVGTKINFPTKMSELNSMFTSTYHHSNGVNSFVNPQNFIDTKAVAFETLNGENIVVFYNPFCNSDMGETDAYYTQPKMCANFIYDLNGKKGPNYVGKDIGFMSVLYPTDSIVTSAIPLNSNLIEDARKNYENAVQYCHERPEGARLPTKQELISMFINRQLLGLDTGVFWSTSLTSEGLPWIMTFRSGRIRVWQTPEDPRDVWCVRRIDDN